MKHLFAAIAALSLTIPALAMAADNGRGGGRFGGGPQAAQGQDGGNFGRGGPGRAGNGRGGNNAAINPGGGRGNFVQGNNGGRRGNVNPNAGNFGRGGNDAIAPLGSRGNLAPGGNFGRGGNQAGAQNFGRRGPVIDRDRFYGDNRFGRPGFYGDNRLGRDFRAPAPRQRYFQYRGRNYAQYRVAPFYYPRGHTYRRWYRGDILPRLFISAQFYFDEFYAVGLPPPPPGTRWVRYGPDALLVDLFAGRVVDVVYDVFYW
jgi:Ni/Co efflux regulator RcnB